MSLLDKLLAEQPAPAPATEKDQTDMARVLALPRRPIPSLAEQTRMAAEMTAQLRRDRTGMGPCACAMLRPNVANPCITDLRPVQGWLLYEAAQTGGALGFVNVGGGKCLAKGSEFFDALAGRRMDVSEPSSHVRVSSLLHEGLGTADGSCFASGEKACCRIVLVEGSALTASLDHPILTQRGWVAAADLLPADFVAVPRWAPQPTTPLSLRPREAELLGYLYADGACTGRTIKFTDDNPAVLDAFCEAARSLGFEPRRFNTPSKATDVSLVGAVEFKAHWGLNGLSKHKRLDARLWGMGDADVKAFLNAFLACDGHVGARKVEVILASEGLIDDLRFLLLRIGVRTRKHYKVAKLRGKVFDAWRITASGADALAILSGTGDLVGSEGRCQKLRAGLENISRNTNVDVVPFGASEFLEACEEMGWSTNGGEGSTNDGSRPRTTARRFMGITQGQNVSREKFTAFCERFGYRGKYTWLITPGVAWERVESNTLAGTRPVFDLSVPGSHNFVANGMIVHNTLLSILLPMVMPPREDGTPLRAVILLPPALRDQYRHDFLVASQHFNVPQLMGGTGPWNRGYPVLRMLAYSEMSLAKNTKWLETEQPDIIMADEVHNIKSRLATRTGRFLRYVAGHPRTKFFGWSGSLTTRGGEDYFHLSAIALKKGAPTPLDRHQADLWIAALDPDPLAFKSSHVLAPLANIGETVRAAFHRRLVQTVGVVVTQDATLPVGLKLIRRDPPPMPEVVRIALDGDSTLERPGIRAGTRPDGEEAESELQSAMWARQAAAGCYGYWAFPRGEQPEVIERWRAERKEWNKAVREGLKRPRDEYDSPALLAAACARKDPLADRHPLVAEAMHAMHANWMAVKDTVEPLPKFKMMDDWLCRDAVEWGREHVGIIFVQNSIVGRTIAKLGGWVYYGAGEEAAAAIRVTSGAETIVASMQAHSTGRNLQQFNKMLLAQVPTDFEQTMGRIHREGQERDCSVWIYLHTRELVNALDKATEYSLYVAETTGQPQKLLSAERIGVAPLDDGEGV